MTDKITRDDLMLMIEEMDRGEAEHEQLEKMIEALELSMSDAEALDILEDEELTPEEIADQFFGYTDRDI